MSYFNKKRFTMRQVVSLLTIVFLGIAVIAYAMTMPHTFNTGDTISSSQMNANFTAVKNAVDLLEVYNFSEFGSLNYSGVSVTTAWTKLNTTATSHSFTKSRGDTRIIVRVSSRFYGGTFSGASGIRFQARIDDIIAPNSGADGSIITTDASEFQTIQFGFSGLSAGPHTVSIYARTNAGSSTNVFLDPGGWGGKISVIEGP